MKDNQQRTWFTDIACLYPFGYAPKAPGTWGSLPGVLVGWLIFKWSSSINDELSFQYSFALVLLLAISVVAYLVIRKTEEYWDCHDDKKIVIDELVGQAIPLAFLRIPGFTCWEVLFFLDFST